LVRGGVSLEPPSNTKEVLKICSGVQDKSARKSMRYPFNPITAILPGSMGSV